MPSERKPPAGAALGFEAWKVLLRKDCELQDKLLTFNAMRDDVPSILTIRRPHASHRSHASVFSLTISRMPRPHAVVCLEDCHLSWRER